MEPLIIKPPWKIPARITHCQIIEASGGTVGFARLRVAWSYGAGYRPVKMWITVFRLQGGEWFNVMPNDEPQEIPDPATTTQADVTIFRLFAGKYKIVFKVFYEQAKYEFECEIK